MNSPTRDRPSLPCSRRPRAQKRGRLRCGIIFLRLDIDWENSRMDRPRQLRNRPRGADDPWPRPVRLHSFLALNFDLPHIITDDMARVQSHFVELCMPAVLVAQPLAQPILGRGLGSEPWDVHDPDPL